MNGTKNKIFAAFIAMLFVGFSVEAQTFYSAWSERGASNKIDSVTIDVDNNKVTISIPKANGSLIVFKGEMPTDINANEQSLYAYSQQIPDNTKVSAEYLQTLKDHPPRLVLHLKEGDNMIVFARDQVNFWAPAKSSENTRPDDYDYFRKNTFVVDSTWLGKSKRFAMRNFLDSDSHYGFGMICGLIDGLLEDLNMLISIADVIDDNTLFIVGDMQMIDEFVGPLDKEFLDEYGFYLPKEFSAESSEARRKHREIAVQIGKILTDLEKLKEIGGMMYDQIGEMLGEWLDETIGNNTPAVAGHSHGKILYTIITMFIGVKEVSLMLQGGRQGIRSLQLIKNMACFTGDTPVLTNNGSIQISNLKLGLAQYEGLNNQ
jgi:hypothetical protein